jgi:hypothetical protein
VHSLDVFDEFPDLEWEGLRSGVRAGRAPGEAILIMKQIAGKATINPLVAMSRNPEIRPSGAC